MILGLGNPRAEHLMYKTVPYKTVMVSLMVMESWVLLVNGITLPMGGATILA